MAKKPCTVEFASRHVLERRILTSLIDTTRVAVLLEEKDLLLLVNALEGDGSEQARDFAADLRQLRKGVFGR